MGSISMNGEDELARIQQKYEQERQRRLRTDGVAQFVTAARSEKFKHFTADPWFDPKNVPEGPEVSNNDHHKVVVLGSGFGALLFAARLIQSGISPDDIILIDAASGFGGTWYWNRYPGLMCDVESACYMPLLEETGYTPKHKYSYGEELREYAKIAAREFKLDKRALFRTSIKSTQWDEANGEWLTTIERSSTKETLILRSDFIVLAAGSLVHPKFPLIPGIERFKGHVFHTARWDYDFTGGSQSAPALEKLKDKRVAVIGTGATAIQVVPAVAKWAKQLYVVQRTPSSVDVRNQHPINKEDFACVRSGKGWQRARQENMAAFLTNPASKPHDNLVRDGWTTFPTFAAIVGSPAVKALAKGRVDEYLAALHKKDFPRQERIRKRVDNVVKNKTTAESLKPWYAGWCKRPCFHDEYLDAFNQPNVRLIDTLGRGVEEIIEDGLRVGDQWIDVDLIVFATGFEPWGQGSPAHRAGITVIGREGLSMDDKWERGVGTLHGVLTRSFPNLILPGGGQAGTTVNQVHQMDVYATHVGHIIAEATKRAKDGTKIVIEPTQEAEDDWTAKILSMAHGSSGLVHCTPSYMNGEGSVAMRSVEERMRGARRSNWAAGILDYTETIKQWEAEGGLAGLEVRMKPLSK